MAHVVLDFETRSGCDLEKCGSWVYSQYPNTQVLCLGYSFNGAEPKLWAPLRGESIPADLMEAIARGDTMVAHNVGFEKDIWRHVLRWPEPSQWYDTMATCARKVLPLGLDEASRVLDLRHKKDARGSELINLLCKPRKDGSFNEDPALLEEMYAYCLQDVRAEVALFDATGWIGEQEFKVWKLDQEINERGIGIDLMYVRACLDIVDQTLPAIKKEFTELTGIAKAGSQPKCKAWLHERGIMVPDLKKETLADILEEGSYEDIPLTDETEQMLRLRQKCTSTSLSKLERMLHTVGEDGSAHRMLQYHGASTGRWAGRFIQVQNFPRGVLDNSDPAQVYEAISTRDAETVRMMYGCPIDTVTTGLRHALVARPGKKLIARDFSQIEARILLAVAGAMIRLQEFISDSPYCTMAEQIYKFPVAKKTHPKQYDIGKKTVLGAGFQMGWRKFKYRYARQENDEFAQKVITAYREEFAPEVPKLWKGLQEAATIAVWEKRPMEAYGVRYEIEGRWLTALLPSGRKLYYFNPRPTRRPMPWDRDDIRPGWSYQARKMGMWRTIDAYGGLQTENVISGLARDILVHAMFNVTQADFPIVFTVTDEIVCEVESWQPDDDVLGQIMEQVPPWAKALNILIATEGFTAQRYQK